MDWIQRLVRYEHVGAERNDMEHTGAIELPDLGGLEMIAREHSELTRADARCGEIVPASSACLSTVALPAVPTALPAWG